MNKFVLDPELLKNSMLIGKLRCSQVLLVNNCLVPWFILVPEVEGVCELYELDRPTDQLLQDDIISMSKFIKHSFDIDKLNIAAIGNIVKQLHVHVVGRRESDCAWPGVVWGMAQQQPYEQAALDEIMRQFDRYQTQNG
jgi:diadenosine tetraphosphate (Ap4A) HIT family hydrolase